MTTPGARLIRLLSFAILCWLAAGGRAEAQFGALVSPGPLAKAHASVEGASNCQKCHEAGRKVTAAKCLTCHEPVARRIQEQRGVHKGVTECVKCHVDHAGVDGELRPFDTAKFSHFAVTGFNLDGKHVAVAAKCESCHKGRSFLTASPACVTCHVDVHKGSLGVKCQTCHPTTMAFKDAKTSFDHNVTKFPLLGAHRTTTCVECHTTKGTYTIPKAACADCHKTPHPKTIATACATCHSADNWKTKKFDHSLTAFPLKGEHAKVECQSCHKQPAAKVKPPSGTCAVCHADVHRGDFKQDCKSCHAETGWARASFDHAAGTVSHFALADGHGNLACRSCHTNLAASAALPASGKTIDFRGQKTACAACHVDVHQGELGAACETCHTVKAFAVTAFKHPGAPEFYAGQHAAVACAKCHKGAAAATGPALVARKHTGPLTTRFKTTPVQCVACHADPHLGQVSTACETCHSIEADAFDPDRFTHDRSRFKLLGKHGTVLCGRCHKKETAVFPAGRGTTTRLVGLDASCKSCHDDVHLGQVAPKCETCHTTDNFKVAKYKHLRALPDFFAGSHNRAKCDACHKTETAMFPAGRGTTVQFKVGTKCVSCHKDVHNGTLGQDCASCHKPSPLPSAHLATARPEPARSGVGL